MTIFEKMMKIDRRWIYLAIGIAVIIPTANPFDVPVTVSPEVRRSIPFVE